MSRVASGEVVDIRSYSDHQLIVGLIVQTYKDESRFLADGSINLDNLSVPLYIGRSNYRTLNAAAPLENHWAEEARKI
ncbi:hypothetical protein SC171_20135 [Pantoea cypripedii]|uniref:hypothetical protein n=1 Tax=Pantoea cypripedii TaxID=55209 RepID=UPI002FC9A00C